MYEQTLLFPIPARLQILNGAMAHREDPDTSRLAAEQLVESGGLARQQQAVFDALHRCDGSTHGEIGQTMGCHWLIPARRLPELQKAGLVKKGEPRICRVKGSRCVTWWLVDAGSAAHEHDMESVEQP